MELKNSKILITGGSLGIGRVTAKLLIDAGAKVGITGRNRDRLGKAAKETGAFHIVADIVLVGRCHGYLLSILTKSLLETLLKKYCFTSLRATAGSTAISYYLLHNEARLPRPPSAFSQ